jgi:hypothetical protein
MSGEIKYIPFETNPECSIQTIGKVEFSEALIFVNEAIRLLNYAKYEKFIKEIGLSGWAWGSTMLFVILLLTSKRWKCTLFLHYNY